jgi:hypothetical protein
VSRAPVHATVWPVHPEFDELMSLRDPTPAKPVRFMAFIQHLAHENPPKYRSMFASSEIHTCPFAAMAEAAERWLSDEREYEAEAARRRESLCRPAAQTMARASARKRS